MTFGIPSARGKWKSKWRGGRGAGGNSRGGGSKFKKYSSRSLPKSSTKARPNPYATNSIGDDSLSLEDVTNREGEVDGPVAANSRPTAPEVVEVESSDSVEARIAETKARDELDEKMGFWRYSEGPERLGWMVNLHATTIFDGEWPTGKSAVDMYFLEEDGGTFKATVLYQPYFYVMCKPGTEPEVEDYIRRRFEHVLIGVEKINKDDLSQANHLLGIKRTLLKIKFWNMQNLMACRRDLLPAVNRNKAKQDSMGAYEELAEMAVQKAEHDQAIHRNTREALDYVVDLREYDVMYYIRAAINCDLRVGLWYDVKALTGSIILEPRPDKVKRADPVVLAFDIETTKLPLKFPDASIDSIMMISYMIDGQGFLITNREIVSEDIDDFEYTPKPEYEGVFTIFNEPDEGSMLRRFFEHIQEARPTVFVTYNGDFFDWPFVEARAAANGINMKQEIGFCREMGEEYKSYYGIHMDALCWVKRDSYLPQGSQGLKAVTTAKLGYNPDELDPEDMTRFASEQPQKLAEYSVSDAVATYYLYMKYVHPFIFSLCNIIPMNPDDVLRRGSGTLCETLLMVQAHKANVIMPNKHQEKIGQFFDGHLLESETYVGGHVEALEAGVFRSDIPVKFRLVPEAFQQLIDEIDAALRFSIIVEGKLKLEDVMNYDEVKAEIVTALENLRDIPNRLEKPSIYHLDVAAMYPNIILTNRLQPDAIVNEEACASCDFNLGPGSTCQRKMLWSWRGEYFPAKRSEYNMIKNQLEQEKFPGRKPDDALRAFHELSKYEQHQIIKKRVSTYSRKVYAKIHESKVVGKESIVCQRENPFYVNTVRDFRDRRYEYKGLHKTWKKKLDEATQEGDLTKVDEAKKLIVVYDSLQLAHKCILNSFYGYVMRKGARWYSMEMAGIVCLTGATIIQLARSRIEQIGRPLELDTDGIWCIFPATFPENFAFKLKNGKIFPISYPCVMLNHLVHDEFTNHQYQELADPVTKAYSTRSENSIFFEVDGPYRAMILPSSTEEDKLLKKRYAVFNDDGSLAELKGFEVKRRGELKLIKIFQSHIFKVFLEGGTLAECYAAVARVADQWLDVLYSKGANLDDDELFELISENRSMSKGLEEYGAQKSTSISTARRLAEFLGDQMVKDRGLNCKFVISAKPAGLPVSERAIPVVIFQTEESIKKHYLKKWLKDSSMTSFDIREILDWKYYLERFGSVIQKLITIPAAMQGVANPVPRVRHPDWLHKRVAAKDDKTKQYRITEMFDKETPAARLEREDGASLELQDEDFEREEATAVADMEDIAHVTGPDAVLKRNKPLPVVHKRSGKRKRIQDQPTRIVEDYDQLPERDRPENMPSMYEDYPAWLEFQKRKWKRRRAQVAMHKSMFGNRGLGANAGAAGQSSTVAGFFRQQTRNVLSLPWQILQIAETDIPGDFRVWALIEGTLHSIKLSVPRTFYVNSRIPDPEEDSDRVGIKMVRRTRTLPRSHPCLYLYEMTMSESFYRENASMLASMANHQQIEGVYELQVPLLFRALIKLGCVSTIDRKRVFSGRGLEDGFDLDEVNHKTIDSQTPYLSRDTGLHYLYLFQLAQGSRQIVGVFSTALQKAWIYIVDPGRNRDQIPNMQSLYADRYEEAKNGAIPSFTPSQSGSSVEPDVISYSSDLEVSSTVLKTEYEAMAAVNATLREYQEQRRGPTVIALQSLKSSRHLLMNGITLIHDFPIISLPAQKKDLAFPSLGWQAYVSRRMMMHYLTLNDFLKERIALSRYADVPFCNIAFDYTAFLADLGLARRLKRADMILWYSLSEKPDLGGREQDDNRFELEELVNPEINLPGAYDTVTIEVEVWDLALNTLMQSGLLTEDGVMGGNAAHVAGHLMDDYTSTPGEAGDVGRSLLGNVDESEVRPATFNVLKSMVMGWADEVRRRNRFASFLLEHLYRWLTSSSSKLYDPALFSLVHGLMRRVFVQLIAEFKKLGSKIIYASFEKIVLQTTKRDLGTAVGYSKYILEAVNKKPMLEMLELKAVRYWGYLLWLDLHNYGGLLCENVDELLLGPVASEADESNEAAQQRVQPVVTAEMEWNIGEYLPPIVQPKFMRTIAEYIFEIQAFQRKIIENSIAAGYREGQVPENDGDSPLLIFLRELISTKMKRRLLKIVPEIYRKREGKGDPSAYKFPLLPGSHLHMTKPAMEFVKCVTAVFGLDENLEREVRGLKRDLLMLIGEGEFSEEAKFVNPCEPFKLAQVICEVCNHCRDVDLTRDRDLFANRFDDEQQQADKRITWLCPACQTEYDTASIEQRMVEVVQRRLAAWQQQDTKCSRCKLVKSEDLRENCADCSGMIVTDYKRDEFVRRMKVFGNLAEFCDMHMLKEVVEWVMRVI
ncbi:hypothetical protein BC832DRAFT_282542 [Gaertneriomyces semiglobifer]|nr:hypothetical protein BC832DRAFT_282542 [Gaertneriomyces semiglobifer]